MDPIKAHNKEILKHLESRIIELNKDYNRFNNAYQEIRSNSLGHLLKSGINIIFELFFYSLAATFVIIGVIGLIDAQIIFTELSDQGALTEENMEIFGGIVIVCCILILCCGGFLFMVGLLFTKIRKKNKTLKRLSILVENALKATNSALQRAKNSRKDVLILIKEAERMERRPPPPPTSIP